MVILCRIVDVELAPSHTGSSQSGHINDTAQARACMQLFEGLVDVVQLHAVGNEVFKWNLTFKILFHEFGHTSATLVPPKGGAQPLSPSHELKRPRRNFLPGCSNTNDDTLAPTAVSTLKRRTHCIHATNCLESVVNSEAGLG